MFLLYSAFLVSFYLTYKRMMQNVKPIYGGPTNPLDDMPVRIMPHVLSCVSYDEEPGQNEYIPDKLPENILLKKENVDKTSLLIKDLSYRRVPKEYQGYDMRFINDTTEIDKQPIWWNQQKMNLYLNLNNPKLSLMNKIHLISVFEKIHGWSASNGNLDADKGKYIPNIFGANLLDEWEFDL